MSSYTNDMNPYIDISNAKQHECRQWASPVPVSQVLPSGRCKDDQLIISQLFQLLFKEKLGFRVLSHHAFRKIKRNAFKPVR